MSDSERRARYESRLKALGLTQGDVHGEPIRTADYPGGLVLSADAEVSVLPPKLVPVASIAELKRLYGTPDEDLDSGRATDRFIDYPPELPPERANLHDTSRNLCDLGEQLTAEEHEGIRRAADAYVRGDSRRVASYEPLLNALLFPTQVALFTGGDVTIQAGSPLVFQGTKPIVASYDNVKVEPGGQIISSAPLDFSAVVFDTPPTLLAGTTDPTITVKSADQPGTGTAGGVGGPGGQGNGGTAGVESGVGNKATCTTQPGSGYPGNPGGAGTPGSAGAAGNNLYANTYNLGDVVGTITVQLAPGKGQQGGQGGTGGIGGTGGPPGTKPGPCTAANGGGGGSGGTGGKGGTGGTGAAGSLIQVFYSATSTPSFVQSILSGGGGPGGSAGEAGSGGAPGGAGGGTGGGGNAGDPGGPGAVGAEGKVVFSKTGAASPASALRPPRERFGSGDQPPTVLITGTWGEAGATGGAGSAGGTGGTGNDGKSTLLGCSYSAGPGSWGGQGGFGGPGGPASSGGLAPDFTLIADVFAGNIVIASVGGTGGTGGPGGAGGSGGAGGNAGHQPSGCSAVVAGGTGGTGGDGGFGGAAGNGGNGGGVYVEYGASPPDNVSASSLGGPAGTPGGGGGGGTGGDGGSGSDGSLGTTGQIGSANAGGPAGNVGSNGKVSVFKTPS